MLRSVWFYLLAAAVVSTGGWFYYAHYQTTTYQAAPSAPTSNAPSGAEGQPKNADDELNKKRQEGIGSIKDLKPVPVEPNADRKPGK